MVVVEKGYAKINLGLEVISKREDGYHELDMVMTSTNLYDELYFSDNHNERIEIDCDKLSNLKLEKNLVYKAIKLMQETYNINKGVKAKIIKRIPEQAGLAGGSADAAATLRALNKLWNLGLSLERLAELGLILGSDVPFCIYNKTARVRGRGEKLDFIKDMPFAHLVLVYPGIGFSTKQIFENFTVACKIKSAKIDKLIASINDGEIETISSNLFNDLEIGITKNQKTFSVQEIKNTLLRAGALNASMTGSGSVVYGICSNEKQADNVIRNYNNFISKGFDSINHSVIKSTVRSNRQATKIKKKVEKQEEIIIEASTTAKAYAMVSLANLRVLDEYKTILSPLSHSENLNIKKISLKKAILIRNNIEVTDGELFFGINKVVEHLGYGLIVEIEEKFNNKFNLISDDNYLSSIIASIVNLDSANNCLFSIFPKRVNLYNNRTTVYYDSKTDDYEDLGKAVFGYVLLANLNIKDYSSPRYTKQCDVDNTLIDEIKEGIIEKNFYKIAASSFNSTHNFDQRKIEEITSKNYISGLREKAIEYGAVNSYLSNDGKNLIVIARYDKHLKQFANYLKVKHPRIVTIITSLNTDVIHQKPLSSVIKTPVKKHNIIAEERVEVIDSDFILKNLLDTPIMNVSGGSKVVYDLYITDEASPFDNSEFLEDAYFDDEKLRKIHKKKTNDNEKPKARNEDHYEALLYVHSAGSIFKQFDFIDIANYFLKFYDGKSIYINIDDKVIEIEFNTRNLPHILGLHLLNNSDDSYKGTGGFLKLLNGEIKYKDLKSNSDFNKIVDKAVSTVLILNDIFNNRLHNIYCFPKDKVIGENTKMEKFEFAITRKLSQQSFREQNLLGIGFDPVTNKHFFYTSFICKLAANLGKKDSLDILITV